VKERLGLVFVAVLLLAACNEQNNSNANNSANASYTGRSFSVIGKLRPRADAGMVNEIRQEEEAAERAKQTAVEQQLRTQRQAQNSVDPSQRNLPGVAGSSFSGSLPSVNGGGGQLSGLSAEQRKQIEQINAQVASQTPPASSPPWSAPVAPPPPPTASYGINYTTPSPGFVPPPPAVSLSTSAVPMYGGPPPDYNPYANPYGFGGGGQPAPPVRAPSSGFGAVTSGAKAAASADGEEAPRKKKEKPLQLITPTGMESRSPYKQRDELRMLWKGALSSTLSGLNSDPKLAAGLSRIDVGLPSEASKGSLSVAQRQIDGIFKNTGAVDRKIFGNVKKTQADLVQAYYRYLYAYNKFFLTQQQVQARKQELECAETQAEKQRATVDLANSQQDAESSKDDMRSSQSDLVSVAGVAAARTVIKNVSGVTPNLEAVAQSDNSQAQAEGGQGGGLGGILNVFGFGRGKPKEAAQSSEEAPKVAAVDETDTKDRGRGKDGKEKKKGKKGDKDKDRDSDKDKDKGKDKGKGKDKDHIAVRPQAEPAPAASAPEEPAKPAPAAASGQVSFELKDVKTTPRKSILRVVVRNSGGDNFTFDADSISVAEGNNKLAEASVNAEFDSTVVRPSQEVSGIITIFGRPWNDKLTVSLSSGSKPIFLHR
jgi:hypothetical protein